ncbi:MAG: FtsK/SpoIIIE family DNA translocase [Solirubrobacteraceae bacterium]
MAASTKRRSASGRRGSARAGSRSSASSRRKPARRTTRSRRDERLLPEWIRAAAGRLWPPRLPVLDQRRRDVLGLILLALGAFLAFVIYGGWNGGSAGHGLSEALALLVGRARGLAPIAAIAAGAVLLCAPLMPAARPLRTGALCLSTAILLALAAGTLGASPGQRAASSHWTLAFLRHRGGVIGQALYAVLHALVQSVGVQIVVVLLFAIGLVLLTGASIATALRTAGNGMLDTTRVLRSQLSSEAWRRAQDDDAQQAGEALAPVEWPGPAPATPPGPVDWDAPGQDGEVSAERSLQPPDPEAGRLVVRATHVEAPSLDDTDEIDALRLDDEDEPDDGQEVDDGDEVADRLSDWQPPESYRAPEHQDGDAGADDRGGSAGSLGASPADAEEPATPAGSELTPQGRLRAVVTDDPAFEWRMPTATRILARSAAQDTASQDIAGQQRVAASLVEALGHFGVQAKIVGTVAGPHITRYELRLAPGTKVSKVAQLKDDLAYALAATDIRILAPIPGKQAVGVEVPNAKRRIVRLGDVFQDAPEGWSPLTVWLGKDIAGKAIGADLAKMPHLLVAGTTGAGKSGAINAMLVSVLLKASPHEVRVVLVDPKQVELNHYESIPHLLTPVITSPKKAANALGNLVREMEQRYGLMSLARTRSLPELNKARERRGEAPLPYILCVIDELADLMMVAPADVEDSIIRLAQKARAVGIHLVLATQSPRVDVITGMIKANVPSRIAFAVSSQTDSRVILDQNGAESLLGQGDMLFSPVGSSRLQRIQGAYIDEPQIAKLTEFWRRQGEPEIREELLEEVAQEDEGREGAEGELDPDEDPLLGDAIALVAEMQTASTSMLQRRMRLGYTRAGRLIDMLERRGVISGYEGSKPRQVLITEADVPRVLAALEQRGAGGEPPQPPDAPVPV